MFPLVQTWLLSLVVGVLIVKTSEAYPDGAPVEACRTFRPGHGPHSYDASAGSDPSKLYNITTRLSGHGYEVILKAKLGDRPFKGFIIKAIPGEYNRANWQNPSMPIGRWKMNPDGRLLDCFRNKASAITHADNDAKSQASFVWVRPKYRHDLVRGSITFVATVVENFERYWTGVTSATIT